MTIGTYFQIHIPNGGTHLKGVPTSTGHGSNYVFRMNFLFQINLPPFLDFITTQSQLIDLFSHLSEQIHLCPIEKKLLSAI